MRKLLKWAIITFGIAALLRWWRGRRADDTAPAPNEPTTDPADELRRKLAESRPDDEPAGGEVEQAVDDRRAEVHAEARAAIDEIESSTDE